MPALSFVIILMTLLQYLLSVFFGADSKFDCTRATHLFIISNWLPKCALDQANFAVKSRFKSDCMFLKAPRREDR